jgi:hypothetical protein
MNFDRNGTLVKNTAARPTLRKVKRTVLIDSRDRDPTKLLMRVSGSSNTGMVSDPGDYIVYLPRPFENVVSIRLMSAEITAPQTAGFVAGDSYILLGLEGLNKMDETAPGGDRAGYVDTVFAKIPTNASDPTSLSAGKVLYYNDRISPENITCYNPPISNLNRIHATFRRHGAFAAATVTNPYNAPIVFGTSENAMMLEIEYLDNGFDEFSTFQSFTSVGRA